MAQFGRPSATQASSGWTANGAATHHAATDEVSANDDTDYVTNDGSGNVLRLTLGAVTDPVSSTGHVIRMRWKFEDGAGDFTCVFRLKQGATVRATFNVTIAIADANWHTSSNTLSGANADAITDYSGLNLEWVPPADGSILSVTWTEFEVPDVAAAGYPAATRATRHEIGRDGVSIH